MPGSFARCILLLILVLIGASAQADSSTAPKLFQITELGPNWPQPGSIQIGFIDETGKIVIPLTADYMPVPNGSSASFSEGLEPVSVGLKTKWPPLAWGYLDPKGNFAIEPQFEGAAPFSEGLAAVSDKKGGPPWGRGYIDHTGKFVIAPQFDQAGPFIDGMAAVNKVNDWLRGYIDPTGKWIVPPQYPSEDNFSEGLACVGKYITPRTAPPNGSEQAPMIWGFIDKTGATAIDFKFDQPSSFHEGLAAINARSGGCGYIDKTGAFVIPQQFFMGWDFSEGLARVRTKDGKISYINKQGAVVFSVPGLDWADPFSEGMADAAIRDHGQRLYGFIDTTGKFVIPPQFVMAKPFANGLAQVATKTETGYIDKTGQFVWKTTLPDLTKLMGH